MKNGKSRLPRRRGADDRPLARYRVRVEATSGAALGADDDQSPPRIWWLGTILARSAAEAVCIAKLRLVLEAYQERGGDDTQAWGLMAVPESWWELGPAAALERGERPAEVQPEGAAGSAWDQAVYGG